MRLINLKLDRVTKDEALITSATTAEKKYYPKLDCIGNRGKEADWNFNINWYGDKTTDQPETGELTFEEVNIDEVSKESALEFVTANQEEYGYEVKSLKLDKRSTVKTIASKLKEIGLSIVVDVKGKAEETTETKGGLKKA